MAHGHSTHSAWLCDFAPSGPRQNKRLCQPSPPSGKRLGSFFSVGLQEGRPTSALSWQCSQVLSQTRRDLGSHWQESLAFRPPLGANGALSVYPLFISFSFPFTPSAALALLGGGGWGQTRMSSGQTQAIRKGLMFGRGNSCPDPPRRYFQVTCSQ